MAYEPPPISGLKTDAAAYAEWASFFKVASNADHLCASNHALQGLRSLVRYCTYLKEMNEFLEKEKVPIWHVPSFMTGLCVGVLGLVIHILAVAH